MLIGCVPDLPLGRVKAFLSALQAREPRIQVELSHLPTTEQVRRIAAGELDLGIIHHAHQGAEIETERLFPGEPVSAFMPMNHRLADKPRVGPEDLRGEVLILGPREADPSVSDGLAAGLDNAGYRFRDLRNTKGDNPRDAMFLVAEGTGITVATLAALNGSGDLAALVTHRPLDPPLQMPATVIAWRTDSPDQLRPLVEAAREAARAVAGRRGPVAAAPLTPRELEVIGLAAAGHSAREIAERLVVGHSTVRTHFENIYAKLGVSDKASAVATALRRGLID